jgi:phosphatidylinositol 3-kinase
MEVKYFRSGDLRIPVRIRITSIELNDKSAMEFEGQELCVVMQLYYMDGAPLGLPERSTYKTFATLQDPQVRWDEWITFPAHVKDLNMASKLVITVHTTGQKDNNHPTERKEELFPYAGVVIPLIDAENNGLLRSGVHKAALGTSDAPRVITADEDLQGLDKFEQILSTYNSKVLPRVPWLDKLTYRRIEVMTSALMSKKTTSGGDRKNTVTVEFPNFKFPVVLMDFAPPAEAVHRVDEKESSIKPIEDPEAFLENPIQEMYHALQRSGGATDPKLLKPTVYERDQLERIIHSQSRNLASDDKSLMWTFRYSLVENDKALTKFLRCVRWDNAEEVTEALALLPLWTKISVSDALELLSPDFDNPTVRYHGVRMLADAADEDLILYLLQLVEAIKFESVYPSALSALLIERCCHSFSLANQFYWYVVVSTHDVKYAERFKQLLRDFLLVLNLSKTDGSWSGTLTQRQQFLLDKLLDLSTKVKSMSSIEARKAYIRNEANPEVKELCEFDPPILSPLHPNILIHGLNCKSSGVFTSNMAPLRLAFRVSEGEGKEDREMQLMFKNGDDLRRDQLILQLFRLMDSLWKRQGLDLRMSTYSVLATGPKTGFIELVNRGHDVSAVLKEYEDKIGDFLTSQSSKKAQQQEILTNYIRSCAGYCVATYVLGIGDRHLENIMVRETGHLFHVDFGCIFGKEPNKMKAGLITKVRLTKQMLDAMGGLKSTHCNQFFELAFAAYNIIRMNANLFINLLTLMRASEIPELRDEFDKSLKEVEDRLRLDLDDSEEANVHLAQVFGEASNALGPEWLDWTHKLAIAYKSR